MVAAANCRPSMQKSASAYLFALHLLLPLVQQLRFCLSVNGLPRCRKRPPSSHERVQLVHLFFTVLFQQVAVPHERLAVRQRLIVKLIEGTGELVVVVQRLFMQNIVRFQPLVTDQLVLYPLGKCSLYQRGKFPFAIWSK